MPESLNRVFDSLFRYGLGFDYYPEKNTTSNYPPTNIYKDENENYVLEMAVSGFSKNDITVEETDSAVLITGERKDAESDAGKSYAHRGLAFRKFKREYAKHPDMDVDSCELKDGLLTITFTLKPERVAKVVAIQG